MSEDKNKEVEKLQEDLDRAYREMAEGVREFLDLREAYKREHREKKDLKEAAIKAITASSNTSEVSAREMLDEWFKTVTNANKEDI